MLALAMMSAKTPQADPIVKKYLEGTAPAEFRMEYARLLLDAQRYGEAAQQLLVVTTEKPDYMPAWLVRGALELQDGKLAAAEQSFSRYVDLAMASRSTPARADTSRGLIQAYLSLAQIAEQEKAGAADPFAAAVQALSTKSNGAATCIQLLKSI